MKTAATVKILKYYYNRNLANLAVNTPKALALVLDFKKCLGLGPEFSGPCLGLGLGLEGQCLGLGLEGWGLGLGKLLVLQVTAFVTSLAFG